MLIFKKKSLPNDKFQIPTLYFMHLKAVIFRHVLSVIVYDHQRAVPVTV